MVSPLLLLLFLLYGAKFHAVILFFQNFETSCLQGTKRAPGAGVPPNASQLIRIPILQISRAVKMSTERKEIEIIRYEAHSLSLTSRLVLNCLSITPKEQNLTILCKVSDH